MTSSKAGKKSFYPPNEFTTLREEERDLIVERSGRQREGKWAGISLSGGGIRSASFCLGALQALADAKILRRMDYISSVSGGGYIGGGLQWLLYRNAQDGKGGGFPYGLGSDLQIDAERSKQTELQYLRWHANYLLPGRGLDLFAALTVVLRTAFLSVAIWLPILVLLFLLIQSIAAAPTVICKFNGLGVPSPLPVHIVKPSWLGDDVITQCQQWKSGSDVLHDVWPDKIGYLSVLYGLCIWFAYGCFVALGALALLVAFVSITRFPQDLTRSFKLIALVSGLGAAVILFIAVPLAWDVAGKDAPDLISMALSAVLVVLGLAFLLPIINWWGLRFLGEKYKNAEYLLRRVFEVWGGLTLKCFLFALTIGSVPAVHAYVFQFQWLPKAGGAIAAGSGLVSAVAGHLAQSRRLGLGALGHAFTALLASIFLYAVLISTFHFNAILFDPGQDATPYSWKITFAIVVSLALLFGCLSNLNSTGLHRFYRDRLMELFMPSAESTHKGSSTYTFAADRLSVSDLWKGPKPGLVLFPIINCNAILVNDPNPVIAKRGGASFSITPLHVGSSAHGWETCQSYERKNREITVATAVAASGAAASANAGYVGTGVTRNRAVSLVLMLFNIRLGVWMRRPSASPWINFLKPTPFFPALWYGFLNKGYKSSSSFVEITDGGHFDNLGVYELVRRRLDLIVVLDGEADASTSLPALVSLSRRLEEDFGATLDIGTDLGTLMPVASRRGTYPGEAKYAKVPCVIGTITYPDSAGKTLLVYIKATLVKSLPFVARGYRAQNPNYPNETTADQFYSPEQFDAYRELGLVCARSALEKHAKSITDVWG